MTDFVTYEKNVVRELSCRLCLCHDVIKLKHLSAEVKRKIKKLFNVLVANDDSLPKAICHDCLMQINEFHRFTVSVDRNQKFLEMNSPKPSKDNAEESKGDRVKPQLKSSSSEQVPKSMEGDTKVKVKLRGKIVKKGKLTPKNMQKRARDREAMPLDEFKKIEKVKSSVLIPSKNNPNNEKPKVETKERPKIGEPEAILDSIVIVNGKPAKQGAELDKQITLFFKMECGVCKESGFNFRSLMRHYKDRHGVPGYVTCCDRKFHYFYIRHIVEHMAYHLQPNIFACKSCHKSFSSSSALAEHRTYSCGTQLGVRCLRCAEMFPGFRELGVHLQRHRTGRPMCDYCGKVMKHQHRKKNINMMENVVLCSNCTKSLRTYEKEAKGLLKSKDEQKNEEKSGLASESGNTLNLKSLKRRDQYIPSNMSMG